MCTSANLASTNLEVYDNAENEESGHQIHKIWEVLSVEGFSQSSHLVVLRRQQMKQRDDCSFEFRPWKKITTIQFRYCNASCITPFVYNPTF